MSVKISKDSPIQLVDDYSQLNKSVPVKSEKLEQVDKLTSTKAEKDLSLVDVNKKAEVAFEQAIISVERSFDSYLKNEPISYYDLKTLVSSENAEVVVAEINKEIVGSGYAKIEKSKLYVEHDFHSYLGFMYVDPEHRGKGVNQRILDTLKHWSKRKNITHLYLDVYAGNQAAIRAYEKSGFESNLIEMRVPID